MMAPPTVLHWPASFDQSQDLLIVAIDTPNTPIRDAARQQVRTVLRDILGDVELISVPGQPIRLARPDNGVGISVSHESGLSLIAVNFAGPVGIDLLKMPDVADWASPIDALTGDYLAPEVARKIASQPPLARPAAFAQAWTAHEARLKCAGLGLTEWRPELAADLSKYRIQPLTLPIGYFGAVATKVAENRVS